MHKYSNLYYFILTGRLFTNWTLIHYLRYSIQVSLFLSLTLHQSYFPRASYCVRKCRPYMVIFPLSLSPLLSCLLSLIVCLFPLSLTRLWVISFSSDHSPWCDSCHSHSARLLHPHGCTHTLSSHRNRKYT